MRSKSTLGTKVQQVGSGKGLGSIFIAYSFSVLVVLGLGESGFTIGDLGTLIDATEPG
jgi:hypothetical protein